MSDGNLKVTDKRMFTADGQLREEYRSLVDENATAAAAEAAAAAPPMVVDPEVMPDLATAHSDEIEYDAGADWAGDASYPSDASNASAGGVELPGGAQALGSPSFFDLVAMLAEPVSIYLGDVPLPDGRTARDLEMARLHIDLLEILRQRTAGNLEAQEAAFLEDLMYRLRLRYVRVRG